MASDWIVAFVGPLAALDVQYMVTGSVASIAYGEPRTTLDIDVVVRLAPMDVPRFLAAFPESAFYRTPEDVIRQEIGRPARGHFNLIHLASGLKADFYPAGRDPLHQWGLNRRRLLRIEDLDVFVAPPEYVIVRKLEYHREGQSDKHLRDIAGILALTEDLDLVWLDEQVGRLGLEATWQPLRAELDRRGGIS